MMALLAEVERYTDRGTAHVHAPIVHLYRGNVAWDTVNIGLENEQAHVRGLVCRGGDLSPYGSEGDGVGASWESVTCEVKNEGCPGVKRAVAGEGDDNP